MNTRGVGVIGHTYLWRNEEDGKQATKLLRQQHAALTEVVEGLEKLAAYAPFQQEDNVAYAKEFEHLPPAQRVISIHMWMARRLLARLPAQKEGA